MTADNDNKPELSDDAKKIVRQGKALEAMAATPGWRVFVEILQSQADTYGTKAVTQAQDLFGLVSGEYAKGVLYGLRLAMTLPALTVADKETLLAQVSTDPNEEK